MAPSKILRNADLDRRDVWQARVDLAACFRAAARLGLPKGVCNHLSFMVPGRDDRFLVNPDGWAFSESTALRLLICAADAARGRTGLAETAFGRYQASA